MQEVMWGGPAFQAGLVAGAQIKTVGGQPYSDEAIGDAVEQARSGEPMTLHLEPIPGARKRLNEILAPR